MMLPTWSIGVGLCILSYALLYNQEMSPLSAIIYSLIIGYLPSYFDGAEYHGNRYWDWFATRQRQPLFNGRILYEEKLDSNLQYIFCSHPHGVMSVHHGMLAAGLTEPPFRDAIPGTRRRHLGASIVFKIPIYRDFLLWIGCVDASRRVAQRMLDDGKSLFIVLGGITEQMLAMRTEQTAYVKNRRGSLHHLS